MTEKRLVIGVGNRARRDDGAGPAVLDALSEIEALETVEVAGDCARLIELWDGHQSVVVVDAMRSSAETGTVLCFDAVETVMPRDTFIHTSHAFGVAEAVETARALGRLPSRLTVWGIEGENFGFGSVLTPLVRSAVIEVAAGIGDQVE